MSIMNKEYYRPILAKELARPEFADYEKRSKLNPTDKANGFHTVNKYRAQIIPITIKLNNDNTKVIVTGDDRGAIREVGSYELADFKSKPVEKPKAEHKTTPTTTKAPDKAPKTTTTRKPRAKKETKED